MNEFGEGTQPSSSRRKPLRAWKACLNCQARKSRCVQTYEDACDRCRRNRKVCTFSDFPQTESVQLSSERVSATHNSQGLSASVSSPESSRWDPSPSTARDSTDVVPDVLSGHIPDDVARRTQVEGSFLSHIRQLMFLEPAPSQSTERRCQRHESEDSAGSCESEDELCADAVAIFPPEDVAQYLLSVVVNYAVDGFFYFDQQEIQQMLHRHYSRPTRKPKPGFVCLALSVFSMGMQWAHLDDKAAEPFTHAATAADVFAAKAQSLVPRLLVAPSGLVVSACLLLSLYLLTTISTDSAYSYLGTALRMSITTNMHKESSLAEYTQSQAESQHRLWWTVYSLERTIGIKLNRPETVQDRDMSTPMPTAVPTLDVTQIHDNLSQQIANAALVRIWSRISNSLPQIYAETGQYNHVLLQQLMGDLERWLLMLPSDLQLHNLNAMDKGYRGKMHLHQNYNHALIILFRSPLIAAARQQLGRKLAPEEDLSNIDPRASALALRCSTAARNMITNFDRFRQAQLLARFSWTDFQGCSTATLVILFHSVIEQDLTHQSMVNSGLGTLRVLAEASKPAQLALNFVQDVKEIIEEAVQHSQHADDVPDNADHPRQSYKNWLSMLAAQKVVPTMETTEQSRQAADEPAMALAEPRGFQISGQPIPNRSFEGQIQSLAELSWDTEAFFDESQILSLSGMDFLASSAFMGHGDEFGS